MPETIISTIGNFFSQRRSHIPQPPSSKGDLSVSPQEGVSAPRSGFSQEMGTSASKTHKLLSLLRPPQVDSVMLREALWSGCPPTEYRSHALIWKLILGCLPARSDRHEDVALRKLQEYNSLKSELECKRSRSSGSVSSSDSLERQVLLDVPRTCSFGLELVSDARIQRLLERVLVIWSSRNPACGYVQGMNDIAVPLIVLLLQAECNTTAKSILLDSTSEDALYRVEADLYWMLSKMLQDVQDHYTFGQPGIQQMGQKLKTILNRLDPQLVDHLNSQDIDLFQIAFRWFNCLMTREFDINQVLRVWDTCIAEVQGFSTFIVYLAAVMLTKMSAELKQNDFQSIMMLLSKPAFNSCGAFSVESLLAEAYVLKSLFHDSPNHLEPPSRSDQVVQI